MMFERVVSYLTKALVQDAFTDFGFPSQVQSLYPPHQKLAPWLFLGAKTLLECDDVFGELSGLLELIFCR